MRSHLTTRGTTARLLGLVLLAAACSDDVTAPTARGASARPALATGPATYTAQDLGSLLDGAASAAYAINNDGLVVGDAVIDPLSQKRHAIRWTQSSGLEDITPTDQDLE